MKAIRRSKNGTSPAAFTTRRGAVVPLIAVVAMGLVSGCASGRLVSPTVFSHCHESVRWVYQPGWQTIVGIPWTLFPPVLVTANQIDAIERGTHGSIILAEHPYIPGASPMVGCAMPWVALDLKTGQHRLAEGRAAGQPPEVREERLPFDPQFGDDISTRFDRQGLHVGRGTSEPMVLLLDNDGWSSPGRLTYFAEERLLFVQTAIVNGYLFCFDLSQIPELWCEKATGAKR